MTGCFQGREKVPINNPLLFINVSLLNFSVYLVSSLYRRKSCGLCIFRDLIVGLTALDWNRHLPELKSNFPWCLHLRKELGGLWEELWRIWLKAYIAELRGEKSFSSKSRVTLPCKLVWFSAPQLFHFLPIQKPGIKCRWHGRDFKPAYSPASQGKEEREIFAKLSLSEKEGE